LLEEWGVTFADELVDTDDMLELLLYDAALVYVEQAGNDY